MIRSSTRAAGPEYKKKNSEGRSYKHVPNHTGKDGKSDGGGRSETSAVAKRAHKGGQRPGTGTSDKQAPHKQRERKELKHVDQGDIVNDWCAGKRRSYK
jgi:hypothetical protein